MYARVTAVLEPSPDRRPLDLRSRVRRQRVRACVVRSPAPPEGSDRSGRVHANSSSPARAAGLRCAVTRTGLSDAGPSAHSRIPHRILSRGHATTCAIRRQPASCCHDRRRSSQTSRRRWRRMRPVCREIELSENIDATERALLIDVTDDCTAAEASELLAGLNEGDVTGAVVARGGARGLASQGSPYVSDTLAVGSGAEAAQPHCCGGTSRDSSRATGSCCTRSSTRSSLSCRRDS